MRFHTWQGARYPQALLELRYEVLRKPLGGNFESALFDGDDLPTTWHFTITRNIDRGSSAIELADFIACLSFMRCDPPTNFARLLDGFDGGYQLRGMAVASSAQGKGIGGQLLEYACANLNDLVGVSRLWCNARINAVPFYEKFNWAVYGEPFHISGVGTHCFMIRRPK